MTTDELVSKVAGALNSIGVYPMGGEEPVTEEMKKSAAYRHGVNAGTTEVIESVHDIIYSEYEVREYERVMMADEEWSFILMGDVWHVFLNDTWYYASADWEPLATNEYEDVVGWYRRFGNAGVLYWVWKNKRDHMPTIPIYRKQVEAIRDLVEKDTK